MAEPKQQSNAEDGHFVVAGANISAKGQWQAVAAATAWLQTLCLVEIKNRLCGYTVLL